MEKEVIERLERVSESIAIKKEKLKLLEIEITENSKEIENLNAEKKLLSDSSSLDFEIAREKETLCSYKNRNSQLLRNIDDMEQQSTQLKQKLSEYNLRIQEILVLATTDIESLTHHCQEIEENINMKQETHMMASEDLVSAEVIANERDLGSKSSTRIVCRSQNILYKL